MEGYRLVVDYSSDKQIDLSVEYDVALAAGGQQWQTMQQWTLPATTADQRRTVVGNSAREHGWLLPVSKWPRIGKGKRQIFDQLDLLDHRRIIRDATELRNKALEQLQVADTMWRVALHAGAAWGLSGADMEPVAGVTRQRVNRILKEPAIERDREASTRSLQWSAR